MKVLLISEHFFPNNVVGAVRPTKIAKELIELGYHVDVFTRYRITESDIVEKKICTQIYAFEDYAPLSIAANTTSVEHGGFYKKLYNAYSALRNLKNSYKTLEIFKRMLKENEGLREARYDVVFSTFGPLTSLFCGMYYKKIHPETKWICDFRDPVVVKYISPLFRPLYAYYEKKACKMADAIVAVSNGYLKRICRGKYADKAYMIPNGYDQKDGSLSSEVETSANCMEIIYVGSLYGGDRDLSAVFKAISELIAEKRMDEDKIRVHYAGKEFHVLHHQASKYHIEDILVNHGQMEREACLRLQFSAHMLLLSTWNDKEEYGVFPGKLLEYMLINRPIISITNGDLPNGEVTKVIREGNLGVAYETACHGEDYSNLKSYIQEAYYQWKDKGMVTFMPNQAVVDRYDYVNIIKKIEDLING